jgi:arginine decarboxylase
VEFDPRTLMRQLRASVEQAIRENRIDDRQAGRLLRFYEDGLTGYTYLEDSRERD